MSGTTAPDLARNVVVFDILHLVLRQALFQLVDLSVLLVEQFRIAQLQRFEIDPIARARLPDDQLDILQAVVVQLGAGVADDLLAPAARR